ncbi:unnamed protein product [Candidula unifasciata]|uniref:Mitochondrial 28S ribosomal protein S27 n=1 Tax=Candidula unifasciata TaxID=100452 RepID=A0A8S3ZAP3_9EUPU|nr:unnamed protein product [Candidula unifasciata]
MATPLRLLRSTWRCLRLSRHAVFSSSSRRYLLSEAYSCNEAWDRYLQSPTLKQEAPIDFSRQIFNQLEKTGSASAVDLNVLAHQLNKMDDEEIDLFEDILARFNVCPSIYPRNDCTNHAIIRGFLGIHNGSRLVTLLGNRLTYGLFPNYYSLNLLMDHFIKQGDYHNAAKVSYHSMIQEDFSNPVNTLLSLYASVHHLVSANIDDLAPPPKEQSDGEENWVKVRYITFPYYDDHFDIKDERFLLGKTLYMLGNVQSIDLSTDLRNNLKIVGSGLYHQFTKGLGLLKDVLSSADRSVSQQSLDYFAARLEQVEARDPNEPEVELALRTIDDVIHRRLPTTDEKAEFLTEFSQVKEQLASQGKVKADFDLSKVVTELVTSSVNKLEQPEITTQENLFSRWEEERREELEKQIAEYKKQARIEEMKQQVKDIQKQEELLTYFDFEEKIRLHFVEEDRKADPNLTISK